MADGVLEGSTSVLSPVGEGKVSSVAEGRSLSNEVVSKIIPPMAARLGNKGLNEL